MASFSNLFSSGSFSTDPVVAVAAVAVQQAPLGGSKARSRIRGPYSDPRIYEAYIRRCVAERAKVVAGPAVVQLKKDLVVAVEARWNEEYDELDALVRENTILKALLEFEHVKRNVVAIEARMAQIARQLADDDEEQAVFSMLNDFL